MKDKVQQQAVRAIFGEVMAPEYVKSDPDEFLGDPLKLSDEELIAKVSRAIRLSAQASKQIDLAFSESAP